MALTGQQRAQAFRDRRRSKANARVRTDQKERSKHDIANQALATMRPHMQPVEGDTAAAQMECIRSRALARAGELLSIPLDQIDAALLPIVLPHISAVAVRALALAVRVDESGLRARETDRIGQLLDRLAEQRRATTSSVTAVTTKADDS